MMSIGGPYMFQDKISRDTIAKHEQNMPVKTAVICVTVTDALQMLQMTCSCGEQSEQSQDRRNTR